MAISDGQRVRALESNAAWASKQNDNTLAGVQTLSNPGSGPTVTNTQQKINDIDVDLLQAQSDITNLQGDVSTLQQDVSDLQAIETFVYLGAWDASTNTPTIADGDGGGGAGPGGVYRVSVAGSQDLGSGTIDFNAADRVVYNSAGVYEKWDVTDEVTSVNGQQGDVVLSLDDIDDVDAAAPANDQALVWDSGNSKWEAKGIPRDADAVAYDNTTSGLTATDVQGAIDEVEGRLDTAEGSISTAQSDITQLQTDLSNLELDDLTDVDLSTAPTDGQVLTYENATTSWKAESLPPPVADLDDLTDVNAPSPTADQVLTWDDVASEWQAKDAQGSGDAIDVSYDPTGTGLVATNVQAAITEVKAFANAIDNDLVNLLNTVDNLSLSSLTDVDNALDPGGDDILRYNGQTGQWESFELILEKTKVEYRTITSGEATAKELTLVEEPKVAGEVVLDVIGGGPMFYGDDFSVSGQVLTWDTLALDGIISTGDRVRISYIYE
jgi:TolA-binding protein